MSINSISVEYRFNEIKQRMWLDVGDCSWLFGVSVNTWKSIANEYQIKKNEIAKKGTKFLCSDVLKLYNEKFGEIY